MLKLKIKIILLSFFIIFSFSFSKEYKYEDLDKDHWAYKAVNTLIEKKIIKENSYKFNGEKPLTRYDFAYSLAKALEVMNFEKANQKDLKVLETLILQFSDELNEIGFNTSEFDNKINSIRDNIEILRERINENEKAINELNKRIEKLEKRR